MEGEILLDPCTFVRSLRVIQITLLVKEWCLSFFTCKPRFSLDDQNILKMVRTDACGPETGNAIKRV